MCVFSISTEISLNFSTVRNYIQNIYATVDIKTGVVAAAATEPYHSVQRFPVSELGGL
jgi:hypothetical protein